MNEFYDVVDSTGNVIETAAEQELSFKDKITEEGKEIILERAVPQLSSDELKKLRKQYVTIHHPRVVGCNHRLDLDRQPTHRNCQSCWFSWFQNHGEIVQQLDEMFTADGGELIVQLQGKKFLHRWRQFMSTVASWKEQNGAEINN